MREIFSRFDKYMNSKGLNDNQVTVQCSLAVGLLSQARKGKSDLGRKTIDRILTEYQDLNRTWLLTGEGPMLNTVVPKASASDSYTTILLPTSAKAGKLVDFSISVNGHECERIISPVKNVDFALTVTGDSMAPEYPNGSRVFIKRINERAFIDWGRVYVLDTCNGVIIKKIMPGSSSDSVRCVSLNSDYPDFEVHFTDIYGMYRVLLLLTEK